MTSSTRTVLVLIGAVLVWASIYVERRRDHYGHGVRVLGPLAFAGGVAAAALATIG